MKRILLIVIGLLLVAGVLYWFIPWLDHGGWSSSGPVGASYPANIIKVSPLDGETVTARQGFCLYFDYHAGNGMDEAAQKSIRYFFDGREVSEHVYDSVDLEYPIGSGELCYKLIEPLKTGWHTAKVTYEDHTGISYEFMWRFAVIEE